MPWNWKSPQAKTEFSPHSVHKKNFSTNGLKFVILLPGYLRQSSPRRKWTTKVRPYWNQVGLWGHRGRGLTASKNHLPPSKSVPVSDRFVAADPETCHGFDLRGHRGRGLEYSLNNGFPSENLASVFTDSLPCLVPSSFVSLSDGGL